MGRGAGAGARGGGGAGEGSQGRVTFNERLPNVCAGCA